jgi:hypothetical protein
MDGIRTDVMSAPSALVVGEQQHPRLEVRRSGEVESSSVG